jgi:spermidine synthase
MQKIRASLSRLFLNKPSNGEMVRLKQLELLQKKHQGKPFVFDEGNLRFMYFDGKSVQSAMKLSAPDELICGYTSAMMAFLLANPAPRHILMIGLGGGSLVKFCYRYLPGCRITVLEIDANVIALREQFMLPADDARLQIIHCNGVDYLARNKLQADVVLLDGFDGAGLVTELNTAAFYADCKAALTPGGILVANIWGKRKVLVPLLSELRTQFQQNVWWCRSLDSYNLVVFSFKNSAAAFRSPMSVSLPEMEPDLVRQLEELSNQMHTLLLPQASGSATTSTTDNDSADYEAIEVVRLTEDLTNLMVTDASLPRSEVEWSARHQ